MPPTMINSITTAAAGTLLTNVAAVDAANGNQFANPTGRAIIEIVNGAAAPITVGFTTQGVYSVGTANYAIADLNVTVANATSKICGPFDKALFNDVNSNVQIAWSSGTTITARVMEIGTV